MTKKKEEFLDLAELDLTAACEKGFEFELEHPVTERPLGIFLSIIGSESSHCQSRQRKKANQALNKLLKAQRKATSGAKADEEFDVEAELHDEIKFIASCLRGWRTCTNYEEVLESGGEKEKVYQATVRVRDDYLEFSEPNARKVLTLLPWIIPQAKKVMDDLGNFMPS